MSLHYRHSDHHTYRARGQADSLADKPIKRIPPPPAQELGRLGGEMARRMVEAALAFLTERAVAETKATFAETAYGARTDDGSVTTTGPKA